MALLLLASAALLCLQPTCAEVQPSDKEALLAFKAGLTSEGGELLSSWVPASDPCDDGWTGVKCSCDDFFAPLGTNNMSKAGSRTCAGWIGMPVGKQLPWNTLAATSGRCMTSTPVVPATDTGTHADAHPLPPPHLQACKQPVSLADGVRVLQLNFGDPRITQWNMLTGTITPALGNLTCELLLGRLQHKLPPAAAAAAAGAVAARTIMDGGAGMAARGLPVPVSVPHAPTAHSLVPFQPQTSLRPCLLPPPLLQRCGCST
jgi:hypothetical protein